MRGIGWIVVVVLAGCPAAVAVTDAGPDTDADIRMDSGPAEIDAGPTDAGGFVDAGTDAGQDSGPACECSGLSTCCPDGCHPAPATTECSSVDGPQDCYPDSYIAPGWRGWDETVTHCGATGACDGTVEVVNHRWSCPDGCARIVANNQSYCL